MTPGRCLALTALAPVHALPLRRDAPKPRTHLLADLVSHESTARQQGQIVVLLSKVHLHSARAVTARMTTGTSARAPHSSASRALAAPSELGDTAAAEEGHKGAHAVAVTQGRLGYAHPVP